MRCSESYERSCCKCKREYSARELKLAIKQRIRRGGEAAEPTGQHKNDACENWSYPGPTQGDSNP